VGWLPKFFRGFSQLSQIFFFFFFHLFCFRIKLQLQNPENLGRTSFKNQEDFDAACELVQMVTSVNVVTKGEERALIEASKLLVEKKCSRHNHQKFCAWLDSSLAGELQMLGNSNFKGVLTLGWRAQSPVESSNSTRKGKDNLRQSSTGPQNVKASRDSSDRLIVTEKVRVSRLRARSHNGKEEMPSPRRETGVDPTNQLLQLDSWGRSIVLKSHRAGEKLLKAGGLTFEEQSGEWVAVESLEETSKAASNSKAGVALRVTHRVLLATSRMGEMVLLCDCGGWNRLLAPCPGQAAVKGTAFKHTHDVHFRHLLLHTEGKLDDNELFDRGPSDGRDSGTSTFGVAQDCLEKAEKLLPPERRNSGWNEIFSGRPERRSELVWGTERWSGDMVEHLRDVLTDQGDRSLPVFLRKF